MFSERAANGAGLALILLAACAAVSVAIARPAQALTILDQEQNTIKADQIISLTQEDLGQLEMRRVQRFLARRDALGALLVEA